MKPLTILSAFLLLLCSCSKQCPVPNSYPDQVYYSDPDPDPGYSSDPGQGQDDPSDPGDDGDSGDDDPSTCRYTGHAVGHTANPITRTTGR